MIFHFVGSCSSLVISSLYDGGVPLFPELYQCKKYHIIAFLVVVLLLLQLWVVANSPSKSIFSCVACFICRPYNNFVSALRPL
jgi:hypothetical protein